MPADARQGAPFLILALSSLVLGVSPAAATDKYAAEFLRVKVGARAIGMGGAFVAIADDATAPYWNPAGLIYLPYREVLPQHSEQFGNLVNHDYLGAVFPLGGERGRQQAIGVGFIRLAVDGILVTPRPGDLVPGVDFQDYGPDNDESTPDPGQGNGVWDHGERLLDIDLREASSSDMALLLSYARHRGTHWAFGGTLKFVRQSIPDIVQDEKATSFGAGVDVGAAYMPTDAITIAAVARDLTTTYLSWSNGSKELVAPSLDTGAAFHFYPAGRHALTWAVDLAWAFEEEALDSQLDMGKITTDLRTGLEYWYRNTLALRSGADGKNLAFGAGVRYKHLGVDYAASLHRFFAGDDEDAPSDKDLDATHLVSASFSW